MPVYNAEKYVERAIKSVLNQSFRDFEFIIIDDGSTDDSPSILQKLALEDSRIHLKMRANKGMVYTMRELVELSGSEYIARMDADDIATPDRLLKQKKYLDENPDCVLLGTQTIQIDSAGRKISHTLLPTSHEDILAGLLLEMGYPPVPIIHPTVIMRRWALLEVGSYDDSLEASEDRDLWLKLSSHGKIANLPGVLLYYRRHFASFTSNRSEESKKLRKLVIHNYYRRNNLSIPTTIEDSVGIPLEKHQTYLNWSKQSLRNRYLKSSAYYFFKAVLLRPGSFAVWKQGVKIILSFFR